MRSKVSINELEALNFAKLIDSFKNDPYRIFLDSPDVISERFGLRVSLFSKKPIVVKGVKYTSKSPSGRAIRMIAEHKADARYPVVSSASIIAKVERDKEIERIKDKLGMEIGSGYPSDAYTISAIRMNLDNNTLNPYIRDCWKTLRVIRQLKINEFIS